MRDDLDPARGIASGITLGLLSWAVILSLSSCGCSERTATASPRQDTRYVPTNLDELDAQAELFLVAEAERVAATAEMQAGPEVVW